MRNPTADQCHEAMNERIFEGRNIRAAVENACKCLRVPAEKLSYDVISYGSSGIFGIVGIKKARIRVQLPASGREEAQQLQNTESAPVPQVQQPMDDAPQPFVAPLEVKQVVAETVTQQTEVHEQPIDGMKPAAMSEAGPRELPIEEWRQFLSAVVCRLADSPVVDVSRNDGRVVFSVESPGCEHLIGKKGQTLNAVLHVLRKYVQKTDPSLKVFIDVNRFRERKAEQLTRLTNKVIQKVVQRGRPITIGSLSLKERDIVQQLIEQDERVCAKTIGNGPSWKMIVSLASSHDLMRIQG